jgi:hypothetical protein
MERTKMAAWRVTLAIGFALSCVAAPAAENVTVIGATGVSPLAPAYGDAGSMGAHLPPPNLPVPPNPNLVPPEDVFNSSWYTRIEFFHWGQLKDFSTDFKPTTESGALYTLGYVHRFTSERVRLELFGGNMGRNGWATYFIEVPDPDVIGATVPEAKRTHASASAAYFGGRLEYEYLWDVNIEEWLPVTIFAGIGSRTWNRSVYDWRTDGGVDLPSESDVSWTIYPYIGIEKRWSLDKYREIFASSRFGCTVLTITHYSNDVEPAYYSNPGITAQVECGVRSKHLFLSGTFEAMSWGNSSGEHWHGGDESSWYYLEGSQTYTTGLRFGITY